MGIITDPERNESTNVPSHRTTIVWSSLLTLAAVMVAACSPVMPSRMPAPQAVRGVAEPTRADTQSRVVNPALALPAGAGREAAQTGAIVVGAILPRSGPPYLVHYADLVLQGIRIALAQDSADGGPDVRFVVADDGGDPNNDGTDVQQLASQGAVAVVGPLLSEGLVAAAQARPDPVLPLVSPTATASMATLANVYTLNGPDVGGARALGRYAAAYGLLNVAILYPGVAKYEADVRAFTQAFDSLGGHIVASVPYDSGATTFADWIQPLVADSPQAIYVPTSERDVRQLAPQLRYYGLDTLVTRVLGNETWTTQGSRRVLIEAGLNGVIATTPLLQSSPEVAWQDFVQRYEQRYRRTLDNPYPALGYDALRLILRAIPGGGGAQGVASRLAATQNMTAATGVISIVDGQVHRQPFVVVIHGHVLDPAPPVTAGLGTGASREDRRR